ncbi:hypothetical protein BV22DRAFT_14626 [Leucogyrophana mollusca]|uniref:Uncharacterized protein n=1 Tax=Leucogyrophana mollusca TaxID=85980 RepID=A0ACB8C0C3_9AGAM|nr:hypothetical protein BV22DRAFT_14626 [Leucogyrophana mollusca]
MLAAMPADVLYKIFIHLEVIDLVRLQQVSSRFLDIIDERNVWSDAYRKSSLPQSRGPFVWQSSAYLRSALITSAKLKRTWPTRSAWLKKIPTRDIMFTETLRHFQLLLGRWLIVVIGDGEKQVCCYDLDSEDEKSKKHVIYHVPSGADVAYLGCTDVATTDGQFSFVAFMHRTVYDEENEGTLKVYKLTSETGSPVCFELVLELCRGPRWPHIQIAPQVLLIVGRAAPDNYHNKTWIMDIRTNRVYKLPPPAKDRPTEMAVHADRLPVKIFPGTNMTL